MEDCLCVGPGPDCPAGAHFRIGAGAGNRLGPGGNGQPGRDYSGRRQGHPRLELAVCTLSGGKIAGIACDRWAGGEGRRPAFVIGRHGTKAAAGATSIRVICTGRRGKKSLHEPYEAQVKILELQLEQARRDLAEAETNLQKIKKLYEEGALTASGMRSPRPFIRRPKQSGTARASSVSVPAISPA